MKNAQVVEFQRLVEVLIVDKIRVTFTKKDRAKYISHLDLNRVMQRALKRARIPVWYTEGFNPHAYIMFPLALSLGVESDCEIMDFTLVSEMSFDEIKTRLNESLPVGIVVNKVDFQQKKHTEILKSEYKLLIKTDLPTEKTQEKFDEFMLSEKIEVEKKTKKKGINLIDIKPSIEVCDKKVQDDAFVLVLKLPAGTQTNINPTLVTEAFESKMHLKITDISIERTKILCANDEIFN